MSKVKISVIIPVYNMEDYLEQCLDSVLLQTLGDIELVCVNDGSTDSSLDILRSYAEKDERVVIYDRPNTGVGRARNDGIDRAKGEFVIFMDPDDYYPDSDILEALYRNAKKHKVKVCGGSFSELHENGYIRTKWEGLLDSYTFYEDRIMRYDEYQFDFGYHRFIYSRRMLNDNNIRFPLYKRFQDPPFMVEAMIAAGSFYAMRKITYCYRWGHQNLKWDETRTYDVLCGLCDDLRMSAKAGLRRLHTITFERLTKEFLKPIALNIDSPKIIAKLNETYAAARPSLLEPPYPDRKFYLAPLYESAAERIELEKELAELREIKEQGPGPDERSIENKEERAGFWGKLEGLIHCIRTNGFGYTVKYSFSKLTDRLR